MKLKKNEKQKQDIAMDYWLSSAMTENLHFVVGHENIKVLDKCKKRKKKKGTEVKEQCVV
jgi:hypothetical protein